MKKHVLGGIFAQHLDCTVTGALIITAMIAGIAASTVRVNAEDNNTVVTTASVTVAASCSMTATVDMSHNATLANGIYSTSTTDYADGRERHIVYDEIIEG